MKYKSLFDSIVSNASLAFLIDDNPRFFIPPESSAIDFVIIRRNNADRLYIEKVNIQEYMEEEFEVLKSELEIYNE